MGLSSKLWVSATCILFFSVRAAVTMQRTEMNMPIPILWRTVNPRSLPVIPLASGTIKRSYIVTKTSPEIVENAKRETGGTRKWGPILLSMVLPCFIKNDVLCDSVAIPKVKQENQMGTILNITFVSSTWVTVQTFHGFGFTLPCVSVCHSEESCTIMAALSRNLMRWQPKKNKYQKNFSGCWQSNSYN